MKFKQTDIDKKWKAYALAGCVCILFFLCLSNLGKIGKVIGGFFRIMKPIILGFVIAYMINPIAKFFRAKLFGKVKKDKPGWILSTTLALIIVLAFIALILSMLIPQITANIVSLVDNYPLYVAHLQSFMDTTTGPLGNLVIVQNLLDSISADGGLINTVGDLIRQNAQLIIEKTTTVGNAALNLLIGMIFAVYFLLEKESIAREFAKLFSLSLSPLKYERLRILMTKFNTIFSKYIVCELLDAFIVGAACYLFAAAFRMPDALFIAVIVGITNLIPTFGPFIGGAIGGFILLLLDPSRLIPFLIFILVIQLIDGYIIKPKLFGGALDVPGVLILVALIIFGKLMGVVGMLIAIPIAAIIVYLYTEALIPRLELQRDLKAYQREESRREKAAEPDPAEK